MSTLETSYLKNRSSAVNNIELAVDGSSAIYRAVLPSGSSGDPSLRFSGDSDTGIYSIGPNILGVATSGVKRIEVSTTAVSSSLPIDVPVGTSGTPSIVFTGDTNTGIYSPGADTLAFVEGGAEAMRITSAGLVGIGTASPGYPLDVNGKIRGSSSSFALIASNGSGASQTSIALTREGGATNQKTWEIIQGSGGDFTVRAIDDTYSSASDAFAVHRGAGTVIDNIRFYTGGSERMRIENNGNILIGTSTSHAGNCVQIRRDGDTPLLTRQASGTATTIAYACWHEATSGNNSFITFFTETSATTRGNIDYNRGAGQVRYNVTSDRRLKSDIQSAGTALNALSAIQVRSYKWTETGYQVNHGFIAQELNEVAPDAVKAGDDGEEVTDAWAVDNGKLVPLLTKALQEAITKIETLEARLTAAGIE